MNRSKLPEIASAVGLRVRNLAGQKVYCLQQHEASDAIPTTLWNPLEYDADAFALMVTLGMRVEVNLDLGDVLVYCNNYRCLQHFTRGDVNDYTSVAVATRLAICEVAYQIGKDGRENHGN